MQDSINNLLNRIKNAQAVHHDTVSLPFSNLKYAITQILEKEGFIKKVEKKGKNIKQALEITLKYEKAEDENQKPTPRISGFKQVSKPGQRIYIPYQQIRKVRDGYGIAMISTSKGLLTNKEARKQKVGGEVICEVW